MWFLEDLENTPFTTISEIYIQSAPNNSNETGAGYKIEK